jgi:hypothetical protein
MRTLLTGALLASALLAGCDNYTYFTVYPGIDSSVSLETRDAIFSCSLIIVSDGKVIERKDVATYDEYGHPTKACQPSNTKSGEWGSLNYSTGRNSGTVEFVLNGYGKSEEEKTSGRVPFVQATSGKKGVVPGGEVGNGSDRIEVFAKSCLPKGCFRPNEKANGSDCVPDCPIKNLDP